MGNKKWRMSKAMCREAMWGYIFILPLVIGMIVFSAWPIIHSFYISLTKWGGVGIPKFVGVANYTKLFIDGKFAKEIINTLVYTAFTVPITAALSLLIAFMLNKKIHGRAFFRTVYFLPNVTMMAAIAVVWRSVLNSEYGAYGSIAGWLGINPVNMLGDPQYIMTTIIIVAIWCQLGYNIIILLAGLQSVPVELYEAAEIDGAKGWQSFLKITLPLVSPMLFFVLIMLLIGAFKAFDLIYMFLGAGASGPILNASRTMVYGIYEKAFTNLQMGYGSAEAVILFFIILILTVIQMVGQRRWVSYE